MPIKIETDPDDQVKVDRKDWQLVRGIPVLVRDGEVIDVVEVVMGECGREVRPRDGNWLNMRRSNLTGDKFWGTRVSRYEGVCFRKDRKKWIAQVWVNSRPYYLGIAETEEEAHQIYLKKKDQKIAEVLGDKAPLKPRKRNTSLSAAPRIETDPEDRAAVERLDWRWVRGIPVIVRDGRAIDVAEVLLGERGREVRPRDGDWLNLRRSNLTDEREGGARKSKYKGVSFDKNRGKWIARIRAGERVYFLGSAPTEEEAHQIYLKKKDQKIAEVQAKRAPS